MKKLTTFTLVLVLVLLITSGQITGMSVVPGGGPAQQVAAGAAPLADGNVVYAASCEQGDVQAAIDSASDGDVVLLPECTAEWTTPGGCTANVCASILIDGKEITLLGAGIDRTRIKDRTIDAYGHEPLMRVVGVEGKPFRITGIAFVEVNDQAIAIESTCKNWRVDHCKVDTLETLSKLTGGYAVTASGHTYGVIDHCSFTNNEVSVYGAAGIEWESPLSLGTSNAVYVENCTFDDTRGVLDDVIDGRDGARYVLRYSAMTNVHFHCHGYEGGGLRGTHSYEFYENRLTYDEPVSGGSRIGYIRGGTGVIFNNTGIGNWGPLLVVHQCVYRICHGSSCTSYPCQDQIGRTTDHDDNGVQDLVPLFEWGNRRIDYTDPRLEEDIDIIVQDDVYPEMNDYIQEGRDFYNDAVTHDPETGVYTSTYADDDSSTKQWVYKPYVYPHPLTQDLALTGTAASGAVGLAWEVTTAFPYPQDTTWQIGYASRVGGSTIATSELVSPTRAYTLTGLVPNIPYTAHGADAAREAWRHRDLFGLGDHPGATIADHHLAGGLLQPDGDAVAGDHGEQCADPHTDRPDQLPLVYDDAARDAGRNILVERHSARDADRQVRVPAACPEVTRRADAAGVLMVSTLTKVKRDLSVSHPPILHQPISDSCKE
jgi:hypothetical protein